jgi:hypothetical protein
MYPGTNPTLTRCEYRIKPWKKALSLLLGVPLVAGSLFVCTSSFGPDRIAARVSSVFFLAGGIYILAWAFRSRLIFDGMRIEVRSAFGERSADIHDVEGYRTVSSRYGSEKQLRLKNGAGSLTISSDFETDAEFNVWVRHLPDLDKTDRETLLDEIKREEGLGATADERMGALATAKTLAIFALVVVVALALVLNFADQKLRLPAGVLLALAPLAVLMMVRRSPLLYTIFKRKADPRADLALVLMVPSFGFLLCNRGIHIVSVQPLLPMIIVLAAFYLAPIFFSKRDDANVFGRIVGLLFFAGLYGFSVTVAADGLLDSATPAAYRATVTEKHVSHGRSTSYTLYLAPWGPFEKTNRLGVGSSFYRRTMIGDQVCLDLYPGTLHAPWYRHVDCATQLGPISSP